MNPSLPKAKAGEEEQGDPCSAQPVGQQHQEVQQEPCSAPCRLRAAAGAGTWPCRQRAAHREQPWAQAASIKEHQRRPPSRRQAGRAVCTAAARPAALQACSSPHGRQEARQPRRESASAGVGMAPRAAPAGGQSPAVPPGCRGDVWCPKAVHTPPAGHGYSQLRPTQRRAAARTVPSTGMWSPASTVRAGSPALRRPSKARRWVIQAAGGEKLSDTHLGVGQSQPCSPRFISRCFAFLLGKGTALGPSATGKGREGHAGRVPPYLSNAIQVKTLPGIRGKSHGTLTWRPVSHAGAFSNCSG